MVKSCTLIRVRDQIAKNFHLLKGSFVVPKNSYETDLCKVIGWEVFDSRYYDALSKNQNVFIELKKGQGSMHFDMIRYSEIVLGFGKQDTVTVFFKWNKKREQITEALVIDTRKIIQFLGLDREKAKRCLAIHRNAVRGVNMLAAATITDLRKLADFQVGDIGKKRNTFIKLNMR